MYLTNQRTNRELANFLWEELSKKMGVEFQSTEGILIVERLESMLDKKYSTPIIPNERESLAFSVMTPKTAALAYDRVYRIPVLDDPVPEEIAFYGATIYERGFWSIAAISRLAHENGVSNVFYNWSESKKEKIEIEESNDINLYENGEKNTLALICTEFPLLFSNQLTIFYHEKENFLSEYPEGKHSILTSAITNIALVEESNLEWKQVLEFRNDKDSIMKYKRMMRWIDAELLSKSKNQIEDELAVKLDDYIWTLKKHGIQTTMGTISSLIDAKFIGSTSAATAIASIAGGGIWAALVPITLILGNTSITFGTKYIETLEERRKNNYEIAYLYDIKKEFGK